MMLYVLIATGVRLFFYVLDQFGSAACVNIWIP